MGEENKGISRRSLLKGAALSAASVAALGMIGCAPKEAGSADDAKAGAAGGADGKHTWEVKPEPIPADKIKETVDTEVLVIGSKNTAKDTSVPHKTAPKGDLQRGSLESK